MIHWIFTVTGHKLDYETYKAEGTYSQRMDDKFLELGI